MASSACGNDDETQVLDLDSPAYGEAPILYGETQALDGSDSSDGEGDGGVDERGKTQLVDEYEETAAFDSGGEGTDRTEVLSGDEEGLSDDDATHCGHRENGGGVEFEQEAQVNGGDNLRLADEKNDDLVDSDASTDDGGDGDGDDDDGDPGSARRSFTAVRAAAVRSSGLAAAHCFDSRKLGDVSRSFDNGSHSEEEDRAVHGQIGLAGIGVNIWTNSGKDLTSLSTRKLDLDHEMASFHRSTQNYCKEETKSRCCNIRVKRLFNELLPSEKDGSTSKDYNIVSKVDSSYLLATDYVVAGLSYVGSQEPSDLSQANALETVDKFLSINDVGSSQATKDMETDILKSPLVSGTKGVQLLAGKTDCGSPVGKPGIFDWNDSLEDEGGGEFFSKRKDSFFEGTCGARKTRSHPPKSRHAISGITRAAVDKSGGQDASLEICVQGTALVHSDSRSTVPNPIRSEKPHISETNIRKNLFKDTKGESNLEFFEHQLDITDVEGGLDGTYDVGPDTQMAAEAMEALVHGSLVNAEKEETRHPAAGILTRNSGRTSIMNTSSKNISSEKRTSVTDSEVIMTRSKKRKMLCTRTRRESPNISRDCSTSSRVKSSFEDRTVKRQAKRGKRKLGGRADPGSIISGHGSSKSNKKEKAQVMVNRHLVRQQKQHNDVLLDRHLVYRTRYSERVKLLKQNEVLPNDGKDPNESMDANVSMAVEVVDNLVTDASGSMETIGLDLTTEVKKYPATQTKFLNRAPLGEEPQSSPLTKDGSHYPKRRRTSHVTSGNLNGSLNKPSSIPGGGASETIEQSSKQGGKKKIFIRSVSDILDKVKRKKRSIFTYMSLQADREPSSMTVVRMIRGMKRRSSLKPSSEKDAEESARIFLLQPDTPSDANILSVGLQNHSLHTEKAEQCKLYGSPNAKCQPHNLACTTSSKDINAVSPVCTAKDPPRSCDKVILTSLVARELRRLEATEASTPMLRDMRRRKDMASVRVLCSHHLAEDVIKQQKKILARLGLPTASSISDATHFVADKFVRTQNMLEAIVAGKPVVTPMWLESCGQASCFLDEKNYILRDSKKEREIGFNMPVSLARACRHPLLQDKRVFITPNVKPNRELISSLVKASHGQAVKRIGRSAMKLDKLPDDLLVISCEEDYTICIPFLEKGASIFSSELLLNGIVIQKLEYERHRLFLDHVKQTRSTIWLRHKDHDQFLPVTKCA